MLTIVAGASDLRFALRVLLKTPAVTLVAVLSLALGIGANTAIFGVINALMLRSLPVYQPERLVSVGGIHPDHPDQGGEISLAMFQEIRNRATAFANVFVWSGGGMSNFESNGVRYAGSLDTVSGDYFAALGVRPRMGRMISEGDVPLDGRAPAQVAVISYSCWMRRYSGDADVVGKSIRVDNRMLTIIGVAPEEFGGLMIDGGMEATVPIGFTGHELNYRENLWYSVLARLKQGMTIEQAGAQMRVLWPDILKSTAPDSFHGAQRSAFFALRSDVQPAARGNSYLRKRLERPLEILMALVGAVLLIACVNLANLLLARAATRQHEFAMRMALGAGRWPLMRMLLAESLLLSSAGAALGLVTALWTGRPLLASFWTGFVTLSLDPSPDKFVLAFAVVLAMCTGLLFGIVPAWRMSHGDLLQTLRQSSRTTGGHVGRFSGALVTAQVTLSLVLLLGATSFVRSLRNLETVDLGYRRDHLLLMQLFPQAGRDVIPSRTHYYHELATRLSVTPGVESVSFLHMGPAARFEYKTQVSSDAGGTTSSAVVDWAGPGIFHVMGMHVVAGREFQWSDDERAPHSAVISESLARALFANQNPIGRVIDVGSEPEHKGLTIVGLVNSARVWKFDSIEPPAVYYSLMQEPTYNQSRVVMRTVTSPQAVQSAAERTLESLGYHYSLRTSTLEQRVADSLAPERTIALLATAFSALALVLAAVGLYGILSYAVTRRIPEIGIRMALGAKRADVLRMIFREVSRIVAVGIAFAIPVVLISRKLVAGLLFGVSATDPAVIILSCSILLAVAALAGFLPARRASRVDPMVALRCD